VKLDRFLEHDPDDGTIATNTTIRRHRPGPPVVIEALPTPNATERQRAHRGTIEPAIPDLTWMATGSCRGYPTDWWIPNHDGQRGVTMPAPSDKAVRLCTTCPVRTQCLEHAIQHHEHGYWGGTTDRRRERIRRERTRAS
jgi:WhiB family redox-sensing transcriptional regulator